jgi:hypothetical protein
VYAHAILLNLLGEVIVFMPQELEVVSVFTAHQESIKHLLDVCSDCDEVLPETQKHTKESVVQVGRSTELRERPCCWALESNTTRICPGFWG